MHAGRIIIAVTIVAALPLMAATPPETLNYQGVLRDAADNPLDGTYDMTFRFFDAESGGGEIAVDEHLAAGTGAVTADGGLFNVALGTGDFTDGSGAGNYDMLSRIFRDFTDVWVEVQIGAEVLAPRVKVAAAAYALSATQLAGSGSERLSWDDTQTRFESTAAVLLTGSITTGTSLNDATSGYNRFQGASANVSDSGDMTGGADLFVAADAEIGETLYLAGILQMKDSGADADQLIYFRDAGDSKAEAFWWDDGKHRFEVSETLSAPGFLGDGSGLTGVSAADADQLDGNDSTFFLNGSAAAQTKSGNLTVADLTVSGNDLNFGAAGAAISVSDTQVFVTVGDSDTDDLYLTAGNSFDDGRLAIFGDGNFELYSGNGLFRFFDGSVAGVEKARLDGSGDLQIDGDATVSGNDINFGAAGAKISAGDFTLTLTAGDSDTDDLVLTAGNEISDGRLALLGDDRVELRAGNGLFEFFNGATNVETASLDASGNLQIDGDATVSGDDLFFGAGGRLAVNSGAFNLIAGNSNTDDVVLTAGDSLDDGRLVINGDSTFELRAGSGLFSFVNGNTGTATASLDPDGDLQIDGDATVSGNDINFGSPGARIFAGSVNFSVTAGDADTDDLYLTAGNSFEDGRIAIFGDSSLELRAGNGFFSFVNGTTSSQTASLNAAGDLFIDGDLTVTGDDIDFGSAGASISAHSGGLTVDGGDADTDDLILRAGTVSNEGAISIFGDSGISVRAATDVEVFIDADNTGTTSRAEWFRDGSPQLSNKLAELQEDGDFRIRGTLSENVNFDIAESFLASEPLEPGDLVRVDPARPDGVLRTSGAGDHGVLGVVSENPGVLLGGAPFDSAALRETWGEAAFRAFLGQRAAIEAELLDRHVDLAREAETVRELESRLTESAERHAEAAHEITGTSLDMAPSATNEIKALASELDLRRVELENRLEGLALERFCEKNLVPVALAGRVLVKVDATSVEIRPGDLLSPGPAPGVAVKADGRGPVIGTALEALAAGTGKILTFVHRGSQTSLKPIEEAQAKLAAELDERTPDPLTGTQTVASNLQVVLDREGDDAARFSIFRDGELDGALGDEVFRVDEAGNVFAKGAFRPASMDVAEYFAVSEPVEPGDVLTVDREHPGRYRPASEPADRAVIGVVAAEPGVLLGGELSRIASVDPELARELDLARALDDRKAESRIWSELEARFRETYAPVALTGTVDVKVDAGYGAIEPGDLLVASPTPGHAMRAEDARPGTVIGKALGTLETGTGLVRALVAAPTY